MDAQATFFVVGTRAKNTHLITEIFSRGHEIANHTYTHPSGIFWCGGTGADLDGNRSVCANGIREIAKWSQPVFSGAAGLKNLFVHPDLARRGLGLIGWQAGDSIPGSANPRCGRDNQTESAAGSNHPSA